MGAAKKLIDKANSNVNKVMRVVDPIGAYLKEKTETASSKEANKLISGLFGGASNGTGGDVATGSAAVSEDAMTSVKARKDKRQSQRRQGTGTGSTLLMTEDDTRLQGATLLGE